MSEKRTSEWALRIQLEKEEQRVAALQTRERQHLARIEQLERELIDERYSRQRQTQSVHVRGGVFEFGPGSVGRAVAQQAARMVQEAIAAPPPAPVAAETPPQTPLLDAPPPTRWSLIEIDP